MSPTVRTRPSGMRAPQGATADRDGGLEKCWGVSVETTAGEPDVERIEQLLRFDAHAALRTALGKLEAMSATPDTVAYQRWLLIKAAAQARLGDTEDGARIMREVRVRGCDLFDLAPDGRILRKDAYWKIVEA